MFDEFDLVQLFHENSKRNIFHTVVELDMNSKPQAFKEYPNCPRIELPTNRLNLRTELNELILKRRSCRDFISKPIDLESLSRILYLGYGITENLYFENSEIFCRPCPSGGGLYPYEIYPIVLNVDKLENGIYHYCPIDHSLEFLKKGNFITDLIRLFMHQEYINNSSICIVISCVLERSVWKYGSRGYRYALLEGGHIIQNMCLTATAENLGTLPLGGFYDNALANFIGIDPINEPVVYGLSIGHKEKG